MKTYKILRQNVHLNVLGCVQTIRSDGKGGVLKSPKFPHKYESRTYCEWEIIASKPDNKILIQLETFKIEGKMPIDDGEYGSELWRLLLNLESMSKSKCNPIKCLLSLLLFVFILPNKENLSIAVIITITCNAMC